MLEKSAERGSSTSSALEPAPASSEGACALLGSAAAARAPRALLSSRREARAVGRGRLFRDDRLERRPFLVGDLSGVALRGGASARDVRGWRRLAIPCAAKPYLGSARPSATTLLPAALASARALGAIAQLGERLDRTQEVAGSSPG